MVYSFIVLGIIPGTDVRVTFSAWAQLVVVVFAFIVTLKIYRKIGPTLVRLEFVPVRMPLHANQLHQRAR